jgi:hypothetical protein
MLTGLCNKKGFLMIDAVMAICFVALGVIAMLSIFPQSWSLAGQADSNSREVAILSRELDRLEHLIMNPCNNVVTGLRAATPVYSSGAGSSQPGDLAFTVIKDIEQADDPTIWRITVRVTRGSKTISATRDVMKQDAYKFPATCVANSVSITY